MARVIFHVDLDAFFVAVERVLDPSLAGKPVVVGWSAGNRGVVASASYEARRFGVRSAMPAVEARRLCPHLIFVSGHREAYSEYSHRFIEILSSNTPLVEQVSVDEAYMDMGGTQKLAGPPEEAARQIRRRIADELKITASIGVAGSKLVAKVASDESKPDGLLVVPPGEEAAFLAPLALRKLPGLGPKAESALSTLGIRTLGQLASSPRGPIARVLGDNATRWLQARATGVDTSPVVPEHEAKSISAETTFEEDSADAEFLHATLLSLSERVGARLRSGQIQGRSVTLKLRYHDFTTITRQTTLPQPVDGDEAIYLSAKRLLDAALRARRAKVRLLGVGVDELGDRAAQLSMLDTANEQDSKLSGTVDQIRERFGRDSIRRAMSLTRNARSKRDREATP